MTNPIIWMIFFKNRNLKEVRTETEMISSVTIMQARTTDNFSPIYMTNFMNATQEAEQVCQPHLRTVIKPTY